jgi:hypothetical protein
MRLSFLSLSYHYQSFKTWLNYKLDGLIQVNQMISFYYYFLKIKWHCLKEIIF